MEKNAWDVARHMRAMVGDEPTILEVLYGCIIQLQHQITSSFRFNKSCLMKYANVKTETAKHSVPRYHYFKKIYSFMDSHCIIGEMFLEYLKGACEENGESGALCDF